tara:strand:- start:4126 stop:4731 length:606 start_codon:yes stop_codon:yes gene_type:complete
MGEEKTSEPKEDKSTPTNKKKKPSKGSGLTISSSPGTNTGATISTYDGGETGPKEKSNIYKDPNTGSTIATKEARTNVAEGRDYQVVASTSTPKTTNNPKGLMESDVITGQSLFQKPKTAGPKGFTKKSDLGGVSQDQAIMSKQKELIASGRPSEDLVTGEKLTYSDATTTTALNKTNPALRRILLSGGGAGSVIRRLFNL